MSLHKHAHHQHNRENLRIRNAEPASPDAATIVSVVYVTAAKTFDGPIGGYKTMDGSEIAQESSKTIASESTPTDSSLSAPKARATQQTNSSKTPSATNSDSALSTPSSSFALSSSKNAATSSSTYSVDSITSEAHSISTSTPTNHSTTSSFVDQSAATGSSAPAVVTEKSQGMTAGAKAGLAFGIIIAICVLLTLIFCCMRRKKQKKSYEKTDDEKEPIGPPPPPSPPVARTLSTQSTRTTATAPRLSLRPVTQFLPDLGGRRKSSNIVAATGGPVHNGTNGANETYSEKSNQSGDSANPFGNHAEVSERNALPIQPNTPTDPFDNHAATTEEGRLGSSLAPPAEAPAPLRIRTPTPTPAPESPSAAPAARAERHNTPNQHNLSPGRTASPAFSGTGSEYSLTPASPVYLANGALPPSNVHRVQLDFKPSMEDEIGLQAGQLVRLLHEYDDGWALCIRLDRSQQGVAPRTCLSARPVKPRPAGDRGSPRGPSSPAMFGPQQSRPSSPAGSRGSPSPHNNIPRSLSPALGPPRQQGPRSMSPGLYGGDPQRSMSPGPYGGGPQRSMSPGPYGGGPQRPSIPLPAGKRRSNSASQVRDRRNSPPGPSPMNPNASNMQRIPLQLQAVTAPGEVIPPQHSQGGQRKPVPGPAFSAQGFPGQAL